MMLWINCTVIVILYAPVLCMFAFYACLHCIYCMIYLAVGLFVLDSENETCEHPTEIRHLDMNRENYAK